MIVIPKLLQTAVQDHSNFSNYICNIGCLYSLEHKTIQTIYNKFYSTVSKVLYCSTLEELVIQYNFPIKKAIKNTNLKHTTSANQFLSTAKQN